MVAAHSLRTHHRSVSSEAADEQLVTDNRTGDRKNVAATSSACGGVSPSKILRDINRTATGWLNGMLYDSQ